MLVPGGKNPSCVNICDCAAASESLSSLSNWALRRVFNSGTLRSSTGTEFPGRPPAARSAHKLGPTKCLAMGVAPAGAATRKVSVVTTEKFKAVLMYGFRWAFEVCLQLLLGRRFP